MRCLLAQQAENRPEALAVWTPENTWTYQELDAAVAATTRRLRAEGLREGDCVGLRMPRGPDLMILLWALWRTGAVAAPLSTRLPGDVLAERAQDASLKGVITDEDVPQGGSVPSWEAASLVVRRREGPQAQNTHVESTGVKPTGVKPTGVEDTEWDRDRPATVVFTSGSTGTPKAAVHSLHNHVANARGSNENIAVAPGDRWLLALPLYHVGGLAILFRCTLAGAAVAVPSRNTPLAEALHTAGATHISLVAAQARRLLQRKAWRLPDRLQALLLGGSALPPALIEAAYERGWPIHTSYGCTEMASQVTTTPPGASLETLHTSGRLLPYRQLQIDGAAAAGEEGSGEILLKGDPLFLGYLRSDAGRNHVVDAPIDQDGWYHSGDLGRIDNTGRLHVTGRLDRLFISGGENIQPEEVEAALERLDGIRRAVVVPVPDDEYGQRPVAFVDAESHRPDEWRSVLAKRLVRFKIPDAFYPMPEDTGSGRLKIDRSRLRKQAHKLHP